MTLPVTKCCNSLIFGTCPRNGSEPLCSTKKGILRYFTKLKIRSAGLVFFFIVRSRGSRGEQKGRFCSRRTVLTPCGEQKGRFCSREDTTGPACTGSWLSVQRSSGRLKEFDLQQERRTPLKIIVNSCCKCRELIVYLKIINDIKNEK